MKFTLSWPFPIKHEWNFGGSDGTNGTYKENLVINSPLKYWWNLMSLYSNRNYMTKWLGNVLKKMHIGDSTNCNFSSPRLVVKWEFRLIVFVISVPAIGGTRAMSQGQPAMCYRLRLRDRRHCRLFFLINWQSNRNQSWLYEGLIKVWPRHH